MGASLYRAILWRRNDGLGGLIILLAAVCALYAVLFPGIFALSSIGHFAQDWLPFALVAAAEAVVMLTGGIDLAVGAMVGLGSVVAATTMGGPFGIAGGVVAVLGLGVAVGTAVGLIVAVGRLPAIIVTLATSFIISGVALLVLPQPGGMIPAALSRFLAGSRPTALFILLALPVLWRLFLATPFGIALFAIGENPVGAYRSGVNVVSVRVAAYAISGALQAAAGLFVAAQTGSGDPLIGQPYTLNAIAAAVLGGVSFLGGQGTMRGALAGSLLMTVLINVMFFLGLPPVVQYVVQGVIIVGAVTLPRLRRRWRRVA